MSPGVSRALLASLLSATFACRTQDTDTTKAGAPLARLHAEASTVAPARDDVITELEYRRELARVRIEREGSAAVTLEPAVKEAVLARLIDHRILLLEANRLGVRASTTAVEREMDAMRRALPGPELRSRLLDTYRTEEDLRSSIGERLTITRLLKREAHRGVAVSEADVDRAIAAAAPERKAAPSVRASQIVVRTEEEGAAMLKALSHPGADFAALAKKHSLGPEAAQGGDLGWFEKGKMPKAFDVCFELKVGQVSPLVPSRYGFHIFKVTGSTPDRAVSPSEVRARTRLELLRQKLEDAEAAYLFRLRQRVRVTIDERVLAR